jgi:hypothetical protein
MKKRVRTQPTNPFYSSEPAVARGIMATKPPVQNASLGNKPSKNVPQKPGRMSGFAGFVDKHKPKQQGIKPKPPAFVPGGKSKSPKQTVVKATKPPKRNLGGIKAMKSM